MAMVAAGGGDLVFLINFVQRKDFKKNKKTKTGARGESGGREGKGELERSYS